MSDPEMPLAVSEYIRKNPSVIEKLLDPEALRAIDSNANWCIACGASHSPGPDLLIDPDPTRWTDQQIESLAARLQSRE